MSEVFLLSKLPSLHSLLILIVLIGFSHPFQLFGNDLEPLDTGIVSLHPHPQSTDGSTRGQWDVPEVWTVHSHHSQENLLEWNFKYFYFPFKIFSLTKYFLFIPVAISGGQNLCLQ